MTTPPSTRQAVTLLLGEWSGGDEGALEKLFRWCNLNYTGSPIIT